MAGKKTTFQSDGLDTFRPLPRARGNSYPLRVDSISITAKQSAVLALALSTLSHSARRV